MLVKANYGGTKKYIKLQEACFSDFLSAVQEKFLIPETTTLKVTDDQGVEVDEDVFSEVATSKEICFLIYTPNEPSSEESSQTFGCSDQTENTSTTSKATQGFLEWRVKTVQRKFRTSSTPHKKVQLRGGPTSPRVSGTSDDQRTGDECMEAISLLQHTTNCDVVFQKMRETFQYRRQILQDPQISADVLKIFPRFLDVKGLILQDFLLMFGAEAASRLLEKWNTSFKEKVIQEAQSLKGSTLLRKYLKAALNEESDTPEEP
ncbi:hypothetical protein FQA47_000177, partial [Oryzias melastigma]